MPPSHRVLPSGHSGSYICLDPGGPHLHLRAQVQDEPPLLSGWQGGLAYRGRASWGAALSSGHRVVTASLLTHGIYTRTPFSYTATSIAYMCKTTYSYKTYIILTSIAYMCIITNHSYKTYILQAKPLGECVSPLGGRIYQIIWGYWFALYQVIWSYWFAF